MARKHKASGGGADKTGGPDHDGGAPRRDWETEENDKPQRYNNAPKVQNAAEEKKNGGRAKRKRKRGGGVQHHEKGEDMKHAKHVGPVHGKMKVHAGRAPRKSGGRAGTGPFSAAHAGTPPKDHKTTRVD